jgi:S-(hydroxymethyl)glutathione dehydrogenase/alcohol dehydrogenase
MATRLDEFLAGRRMGYGEAGEALGVHPNRLRYGAPTGRILIRWEGARQPTVWTVPAPDIDPAEARLELARAQGATDALTGGPGAVEQILELTGGFGADYTFEATGLVDVMRQAVEAARMGWGLATVCGVAGKGETLDVVPRLLITGRRVAGSSFGGVKGRDQVPEFVERYLAGDIDVDPLISHTLSLEDVNRGFDLMRAQDGIRSVISFGDA